MGIVFESGDGGARGWEGAEVWFRELVEQVPAVVYVAAPGVDAPALYVSPRVESMLGFARGEWLLEPGLWANLLHPDDRERTFAEAVRAREGVGAFRIEYRMVAKDGRVVWVRDEAAPVFDRDGRIESWRGAMLDITEQKEAEEALRKSEERFRLVARATGEAVWDNDLPTGKQEWDGATEALFGYPAHEGRTGVWWEERIHPEDMDRVLSGLADVLDGVGEVWEEEYRFRKADGSFAQVKDRGFVVRDGSGDPVRMVGSMRDVTERKEAEEALRESERRHRFLFEESPVGMAHLDPESGRWIAANRALCDFLGYYREQLFGMTWRAVTHRDDSDAESALIERVLSGETSSYSLEKRFLRKDGRVVWARQNVSLRRGPSEEPDCFLSLVEDVNERKLKELVPDPLTERELEGLELVARWHTDPEIARKLKYCVGTIKADMSRVLRKLGVGGRRQAARKAVEIGLIAPPR